MHLQKQKVNLWTLLGRGFDMPSLVRDLDKIKRLEYSVENLTNRVIRLVRIVEILRNRLGLTDDEYNRVKFEASEE